MPRRRKSNPAEELLPLQRPSAITPFFDDEFISHLADALVAALDVSLNSDDVQVIHGNPRCSKRTRSPHRRDYLGDNKQYREGEPMKIEEPTVQPSRREKINDH